MRRHLTYANVVSSLCLFILLGGSAYAAAALKRNSVTSSHIRNGQVKAADLAANAVTGPKVKDGSLTPADFTALPQGPQGAQGAPGERGEKGERGETGPPGPTHGDGDASIVFSTPPAIDYQAAEISRVRTTAGQRIFVYGHTDAYGTCSGGPCRLYYGLYVDNQPVPGSGREFEANDGQRVGDYTQLAGMTGPLPAGEHRIAVGIKVTLGSTGTLGVLHEAAGGIAVGG